MIIDDKLRFSKKEESIVQEVLLGKTNEEISKDLGMRIGSVKVHITNCYMKARVKNRAQFIIKMLKSGADQFKT